MGMVTFKQKIVSIGKIFRVMRDFDAQYSYTNDYDSWLEKGNYKYAVQHDGKLYPCKYILSLATGVPTSEFSGGEQTNRVFRRLGFSVIDKP